MRILKLLVLERALGLLNPALHLLSAEGLFDVPDVCLRLRDVSVGTFGWEAFRDVPLG